MFNTILIVSNLIARSVYYDLRKNTLNELLRPHLVIYLHVPINKVQEKIKQRNNRVEVSSSALTPAYLKVMEDKYKQNYLKDIRYIEFKQWFLNFLL